MLINLTNHPAAMWSDEQRSAAERYGSVADMPFPPVPPEATEEDVVRLADEITDRILRRRPDAVLCQGEMTLTYAIVRRLAREGVPALAACTERVTSEAPQPDGSVIKTSRFLFRGFRRYPD